VTSRAEMDALYPEHAKLRQVYDASQAIGDFLENSPYVLAQWVPDEERDGVRSRSQHLEPVTLPVEKILAAFFVIDLDKIEAEKRALLDTMRQG
jgi:hypothetical protein